MTFAAHLIRRSRKLTIPTKILLHEPAIRVRWYYRKAYPNAINRDDISATSQQGSLFRKEPTATSTTRILKSSCRASNLDIFTESLMGEVKGKLSRTPMRISSPLPYLVLNSGSSSSRVTLRRRFSSDAGLPPYQEIGMPSLSPTMSEGNIARWLKKEGDKVSPGDVFCEVETDKATVEMECMEEGFLAKIIHGDGAKEIKVGEVIAITVEDENDIAQFKDYKPSQLGDSKEAKVSSDPTTPTPPKKEAAESVSSTEPKTSKVDDTQSESRIFASPLARKLAEDHNVPLSSIKGTGPEGSIVKADLEDYLASSGKGISASASKPKDKAAKAGINYTDLPLSQIRKVIVFVPLLRSQLNSLQEASGGKRISVNDLVIKAAALALRKAPQCNSSWTDNYIRQYHNVNINVAVQTEHGLFVPVIRDADKKGLSKIADEVKSLAQKAKENSLKPEDYEGGTFTVSNLGGPFGIKQFCAIINPPQSGILAVGSAEKRLVPGASPDQYKFASYMSVTLSCDHRVIDGAVGAEWLKAFKGYIENPESMLL
ncbi:hypothetical protein Sjap_024309 [Stephania japonica]|uniref:Dihydrolipoamide acetyltransferase component of pyruvate dehydrogenase complex n=1 Tax=Stephania japonica TaxID=461633 RepID=A0AAP0EGE0_9MAGN